MVGKNPLSFRDILIQLKWDLIGKDSYRGVTFSYTWLANQLGHFSLTYFLTFIIYFFCKNSRMCSPEGGSALLAFIIFLVFETYNLLCPILKKKDYAYKYRLIHGEKREFNPDWCNVVFDTFTDLSFFGFGALLSYIHLNSCHHYLLEIKVCVVIILYVIVLLFFIYYWYSSKIMWQKASFPFQKRLAEWHGKISDSDKMEILKFLKNNKENKDYLIIFGSDKSNKSSLAVALGTEFALSWKKVHYSSILPFISDNRNPANYKSPFWTLNETDVLILDHINLGCPQTYNPYDPYELIKAINYNFDKLISGNDQDDIIKPNKIIWVIGISDSDEKKNWICEIEKLDPTPTITSIYLS